MTDLLNRVAASGYIIRTMGRKPGQADNIRHFNCPNTAALTLRLTREVNNENNHKVELLAVLEVWERNQ